MLRRCEADVRSFAASRKGPPLSAVRKVEVGPECERRADCMVHVYCDGLEPGWRA
jgi:hypothetical protein